MERIKSRFRDSLWVVVLDIVAVNLAYYLALIIRFEIGRNIYNIDEAFYIFFTAFYRTAPLYTILYRFCLFPSLWRSVEICRDQ